LQGCAQCAQRRIGGQGMMRARMYRPSDEADLVRLASAAMPGWARLRYDYAAGYAAAEALKGACEIVVVEDGEGRMA
ncbi:MAG: hypothetical protein IIZ06_02320, partial [Kiritimatiellae bacterium]|nr:hypothetical protein [Kiritimatiellia bacterium]